MTLAVSLAHSASAATAGFGGYVSCSLWTTTRIATVYHASTGGFWVKQNSTDPSITGAYWATSATSGNSLSGKNAGDGGTASWINVAPATYYVYTHAASDTYDCNGFLPGAGNTYLNATIGF